MRRSPYRARPEEPPLPSRGRRFRIGASALALILLALSASGCFLLFNESPIARIVVDRSEGLVPLTVRFDGTFSTDPDGSIRRHRWDFGDGREASGAMAEHTYAVAGIYEAALTVTDRLGGRATATVTITVRASNALPVAAFSLSDSPAYPRQPIRFDASASYDPDGNIVSYEWDFGDGATDWGDVTTHWYESVGTYTIVLTVRDNDDGARTATAELEVTTTVEGSSTVARHYEWMYDGQHQSCDLDVPLDLYTYYRSQPRIAWARRDYDEYVLDPLDDAYLETVTAEVLSTTTDDYHAALENALYFVQKCIRYVYDPLWFEYPRYPLETLVDGIGDCEDTAILYTSLVRTLGHGALMVVVDANKDGTVDHMVAWVPVEQSFIDQHPDRSFWDYGGRTYAFAETAVEGGYLPLGVDPWGLTEAQVDTIYDVSSVDHHPQVVRHLTP